MTITHNNITRRANIDDEYCFDPRSVALTGCPRGDAPRENSRLIAGIDVSALVEAEDENSQINYADSINELL